MIANYGYRDGSGDYFIVVDTGKCASCRDKPCVAACPEGVLGVFVDDYDDEVVGVVEEHRNKLKYSCAPCKPVDGRSLPCRQACTAGAITHTW